MTAEEREYALHAYVDGDMSAAEAQTFEEMLARDCALRRDERELRDLIAAAGALSRVAAPSHDLWPDLVAQLERGEAWHRRRRDRAPRAYAQPGFWAAAALLVVAGAAFAGLQLMNVRPNVPFQIVVDSLRSDSLSAPKLVEAFNAQEADYILASQELRLVMAQRRLSLSPETQTVVDENLAIIDTAILEMRQELIKDPSNEALKERLLAMYEKQIQLLRQARDLEPAS